MASRPPAYQYYPDKMVAETRHLSDSSYRVYREILDWIWLFSEDFCSILNEPSALKIATGLSARKLKRAMEEIQNPHMPLFKEEGNRLVSLSLRKEAAKQKAKREKAKASANARWNPKPSQCDGNANAMRSVCPPSPSPSPTPPTPPPNGAGVGGDAAASDSIDIDHYERTGLVRPPGGSLRHVKGGE